MKIKKEKGIIKNIKELLVYDEIYYHGKIFSLIVVILSFLIIGCFILGFIIFD